MVWMRRVLAEHHRGQRQLEESRVIKWSGEVGLRDREERNDWRGQRSPVEL